MPTHNEEAKIGCKGIQMPQAWGRDSQEISPLWVSHTAATAAAAAKVFLLDSWPRLPTRLSARGTTGETGAQSDSYWILFITFAELSCASLLLYLLL